MDIEEDEQERLAPVLGIILIQDDLLRALLLGRDVDRRIQGIVEASGLG